ncbi:hypothetical protein AB0J80_17470 [Actinoplanes sp. NPDC049548]|uniref:hypothetical protein n=1 Tax=Actinoplanes sp. NPDC049548 TaxID=3155152 RepID=UPI00342ECD56
MTQPRPASRRTAVEPALWVLLLVSAAANAVTSTSGLNPVVGVAFGVVALSCIAGLVVSRRRRTRG